MTPAQAETEPREGVATQRIRVGAIGLACVFLLVMLATALLHATADGDLTNQPAAVNASEPAEPLAQLGVAPGNPAADTPVAPAQPAPHPASATPN